MSSKIPLAKPFFDKSELDEIKKTFDSGWVAGQGPKNKELEASFSRYIHSKHAVCVNNCTAGLHLALLALGVGKGDEVIVPDYSFPATAHAVLYTGARPVFVDIDLKTFNIDPKKIEENITRKTKVIMPVHAFGQCADMEAIMKIANKHNLKVIEDAACAGGSKYKGKFAGSMGDIGCFSFHARKNITSGEGGINVTNDKKLADKMRMLSCFGMVSAWERQKSDDIVIPQFVELGYNYKLSDIAAAIMIAQLNKIEAIIKKKQELAKYYTEKLGDISLLTAPYVDNNCRHIFQSYVTLADKKINRNKLICMLKKEGVETTFGTYALHIQPIYKSDVDCPNALYAFNNALSLPMFYELTFEQIDFIADKLKECLKKCLH